jgi:branched-chain amino acid transport system ATP-binding protein
MLAIGRALAIKPKLLIMDEPTEGLMPLMVQSVLDITRRINSSGVGVLIVEQRLEVALKLTNRFLIIENGTVRLQGTPKDLTENKNLVLKYLGVRT